MRKDLRKDLRKLVRKAIRVNSRDIENLDKEVFLKCKTIAKHIKRNKISLEEAIKLPAVIIGGLLWNKRKIGITRFLKPPIAPKLEKALNKVGVIGKKVGENTVGKCAEVDCANYLLLNCRSNYEVSDIKFSTPYRPRTSEIIETCENCKKTFI
ncbi:hypothetical protein [Flavobacterium sp. UBA4197]|uniref:hypothetical protein n=1 Tax=Flavobacterium sp. UBA4197 TaxID=1946546 RepID=UPI00257ED3E2|nr:hypothetical protein [Flavobacterium sp. UBA4197]